jgi:hypothetical protein
MLAGRSPSSCRGARWYCLIVLLFSGFALSAQTVSPQQLADLQRQVIEARGNADNAWIFKDAQGNVTGSGLLDGNAHQLLNQATGVAIAWVLLAAVGTFALLKLVDLTVGLRAS